MKQREKPHKRLTLWEKSISLVTLIYEITKGFPREEEFGLKAQLRRAAVSVPSNIAEGLTRSSKKDKLQFLNIARASLSEIDAQVEIATRLAMIGESQNAELDKALTEVEQLLNGLMRSLRT
jgi:four helix bundle protein